MTIQYSGLTLSFMLIASVVTLGFSWFAWQRNGFAWRTAAMELLRLTIMALSLVTLLQPEYVQTVVPESHSTVVILRDNSKSMQTRDEAIESSPSSRAQAIESLCDVERWNQLDSSTQFIVQPFSFGDQSSDLGTDIGAAIEQAMKQFPDLRAVVLASDGDWNIGDSPGLAAQHARLAKVPINTVAVGKPYRMPDLGVASFEVPAFTVTGKPLRIPFTIESSLAQEVDVPVKLKVAAGEKASVTERRGIQETIELTVRVPAKGSKQATVEYRPRQVADINLTLDIGDDPRDQIATNNSRSVSLSVRAESLRVLMIDSYPRWEYRYTRNALERDPGVDVNCLLFHPEIAEMGDGRGYLTEFPADEKLFEYDVVFLGDIGVGEGELKSEHCQSLRRLIESHSGGLVLIPGFRGRQTSLTQSPIADLFPVELDSSNPRGVGSQQPGHFQLTELGLNSLLTRLESTEAENENLWRSLPGFYWHAAVERARPGSQVLAIHDQSASRSGRRPMIATKTFGNGKVLFMGSDGAWRWRKGVEDKYHYRFWGQVVRWMAYQRNMAAGESMRLMYAPDRPQQDEVVNLQANVIASTGEPLNSGTVAAQIQSPSGAVETISFQRTSADSWGLYEASFKPSEGGEYSVSLNCRETGATLQSTILIQATDREQLGRPARPDVLREIATISRGVAANLDQVEDLMKSMSVAPTVEPIELRTRLWCHPLWGGLLIGLLTVFWAARKYGGLL